MTEIKQSLDKIRAASLQLEQIQQTDKIKTDINSVHKVLTDLSDSVEALKENVNTNEDSPLKFK